MDPEGPARPLPLAARPAPGELQQETSRCEDTALGSAGQDTEEQCSPLRAAQSWGLQQRGPLEGVPAQGWGWLI